MKSGKKPLVGNRFKVATEKGKAQKKENLLGTANRHGTRIAKTERGGALITQAKKKTAPKGGSQGKLLEAVHKNYAQGKAGPLGRRTAYGSSLEKKKKTAKGRRSGEKSWGGAIG